MIDCGKQRYESERQAERVMRFLRRYKGTRTRPYHCRRCRRWHLASA